MFELGPCRYDAATVGTTTEVPDAWLTVGAGTIETTPDVDGAGIPEALVPLEGLDTGAEEDDEELVKDDEEPESNIAAEIPNLEGVGLLTDDFK